MPTAKKGVFKRLTQLSPIVIVYIFLILDYWNTNKDIIFLFEYFKKWLHKIPITISH